MALSGDRLFLSINGYGIIVCSFPDENTVTFTHWYDPPYFQNKTFTTLFPLNTPADREDHFLCHLYFNSMVFPFSPEDSLFNNANIIHLTHVNDKFYIRELYPVPPEEQPQWEIVRFLPVNKNIIHLEWKNSQKTYSEFKYSRYLVQEQVEEEEEWEDFLQAYHFTPIGGEKTPHSLKLLCEKVMKDNYHETGCTTFHFLVKDKNSHITNRYIKKSLVPLTDPDFEIVTVPMFQDEKGYYALTPPGYLYIIEDSQRKIRMLPLPTLPKKFTYRDFFVHNNVLVLSWEEPVFMNVGAAGFLLIRDILSP